MDSASAIIFWKDKILLFHRDNIPTIPHPDCWHFPGGGIEEGETPLEGMIRELSEEVSHVPKNLKFLKKFKAKDGHYSHLHFCLVEDEEADLFKLGPGEGQAIGFFSLDEISNLKLTPGLKKIFVSYKNELKKALDSGNLGEIIDLIIKGKELPADV